jgi:hypothetical protein
VVEGKTAFNWRRLARFVGWTLLSISVLVLSGYLLLKAVLHNQGVELSWRGLHLTYRGVTLDAVEIRQKGAESTWLIKAQALHIGWKGFELPSVISVGDAYISLNPEPVPDASSQAWNPQTLPSLPQWIPERVDIARFVINMPCVSGRCELRGEMHARHQRGTTLPAEAHVALFHQDHRADLSLLVSGTLERPVLHGSLALDARSRGELNTTLDLSTAPRRFEGDVTLPELPEAPWLLGWIGQWAEVPPLTALPSALSLNAHWALDLPEGSLDGERLMHAQGDSGVVIELPEAWPLPGLGLIRGHLDAGLTSADGLWLPHRLDADLHLDHPEGEWLQALPGELRPSSARLRINPLSDAGSNNELAMKVDLQTEGITPLSLQADMNADTAARTLTARNATLSAKTSSLKIAGMDLRNGAANLNLEGYLDANRFDVTLGKGTRLRAQRATVADSGPLVLDQPNLSLTRLHIEGRLNDERSLQSLGFKGNAALSAQAVTHPSLKPQAWTWQSDLLGDLNTQQLTGKLQTDGGLGMALDLRNTVGKAMTIVAKGDEIFFRAGNPLAAIVMDWPSTLSLGNGRLRWDANLILPSASPLRLDLQMTGTGIDGIYDRAEISGLDAQGAVALNGEQMIIALPAVSVRELNPGMPLGPLRLNGRYVASTNAPGQGTISWDRAELSFAKGRFTLEPDAWDLAKGAGRTHVHMSGLDLSELLRLYPTEGLSGTGTLDGEMPVRFAGAGPIIEKGSVAARAPGGALSFRSERIRALGNSNPGMKLVADALNDFRYRALNSGVDYAEDGTLQLSIRLEGSNPDIEGGRQINFNINLEEDVPALMTSLQLTDRVSDIIQRRVQESLQRRNAPIAPHKEVNP